MPQYDYHCSNCNAKSVVQQKITEAPLKTCSACGKETLQRGVGGGIGLIFKGSGFYKNDYSNNSSAKESSSGSSSCCPCGKNKGSCSS